MPRPSETVSRPSLRRHWLWSGAAAVGWGTVAVIVGWLSFQTWIFATRESLAQARSLLPAFGAAIAAGTLVGLVPLIRENVVAALPWAVVAAAFVWIGSWMTFGQVIRIMDEHLHERLETAAQLGMAFRGAGVQWHPGDEAPLCSVPGCDRAALPPTVDHRVEEEGLRSIMRGGDLCDHHVIGTGLLPTHFAKALTGIWLLVTAGALVGWVRLWRRHLRRLRVTP